MSIPETQKAWRVIRKGSPAQALELTERAPVHADLKEGEVLVKIGAAALNPVGYKLMKLLPDFISARPFVAENDLAGTVVASRSSLWQPGDRVFGFVDVKLQRVIKEGALAQYTRMPGDHLARLPDEVSMVDGAGITLAAETAYQGLIDIGGLQEGQSVFVNGGSSSVGAFAIQIAKAMKCRVWASASGANEELVRSLGADHFVDYTTGPLSVSLASAPPDPKFHVFLDAVGVNDAQLYTQSPKYLAPGGIFVSTGLQPDFSLKGLGAFGAMIWNIWLRPTWLGGTDRLYKSFLLAHRKQDLDELARLLAAGQLKPVVDSVFAFEDTLKAYDRIMSHRAKGKVVVRVDAEVQ